jgi:isoleucyl-tRNA synthetase
VHLQDWPVAPAEWSDAVLAQEFEGLLLGLRTDANARLETLRQQGSIGKSLDAAVTIAGPPAEILFATVMKHRANLAELLNVSHVELQESAADRRISIEVRPARELGFVRCPRCWRWVPALPPTDHGELCPRCSDAVSA